MMYASQKLLFTKVTQIVKNPEERSGLTLFAIREEHSFVDISGIPAAARPAIRPIPLEGKVHNGLQCDFGSCLGEPPRDTIRTCKIFNSLN
jgi:hypothetical protein